MKVRVLLVDDHAILRDGLRQAMALQPGLTVVGEAANGSAALELAAQLTPDLIILDIHLPDMHGIELTRKLLEKLPAAKVIVFSGDADRSLLDAALEAGACGYVLKQSATEELHRAIEMVMTGRLYFSSEISSTILEDYRRSLVGEAQPPRPTLSDRDKQVLQLVADGLRNKEIALRLNLSPKSVETYRARLMRKLGCATTPELIRFAIRQKLIPL